MKLNTIKIIGFDADDTLWVNEPYYRESEEKFCKLLSGYSDQANTMKVLFNTEMDNLALYGYGTKSFMLSMVETAIKVSGRKVKPTEIQDIIKLGKTQIERSNELIPGVEEVLQKLSTSYRLIVATKGDLLDQERKLEKSELSGYFHHIEIMPEKKENNYRKLLSHLDIQPHEFLMVGNSLKSDILPVVRIGGYAIYVPFHTTWEYEKTFANPEDIDLFQEVHSIKDVPSVVFKGNNNI